MEPLAERIDVLHRQLGIPPDYAERTGLPLQHEPDSLVTVPGTGEREQCLVADVADRWMAMANAAARDDVALVLISAFRSIEYQAGLIRRKLERGLDMDEILAVNAAPGYSEHHSGRAVDVGVPDAEPLTEAFEQTPAFRWLCGNAGRWGFSLTYPRDNPHGIIYEPWHWAVPPEQD